MAGVGQVQRPVPQDPSQVMSGQMVFPGDGGPGAMMLGPTAAGFQQGQASLASLAAPHIMQPALQTMHGASSLVQSALNPNTLTLRPGFPGVPPPMPGGQGLPASMVDMTQNPHLMTPMAF